MVFFGGEGHASADVRTCVYFSDRLLSFGLLLPALDFSSTPKPTAVINAPGPGAVLASFTGKSFEAVERTMMPMSPPAESKVLTEYVEGYKNFCKQKEK